MTDPLAQYRKKPDGVGAQPPPPKGPDEYMAFDAKDRVARLKIRRASEDDPTRSPGYHFTVAFAVGAARLVSTPSLAGLARRCLGLLQGVHRI